MTIKLQIERIKTSSLWSEVTYTQWSFASGPNWISLLYFAALYIFDGEYFIFVSYMNFD